MLHQITASLFIIPLNHWHKRSILLHTRKRLTEDSLFGGKGKFLPLFTDFINILLAANAHESTCKRICERLHERLRQVHSRESTAAPPGTAEAITHKGDYPVVFISWRTHNIFPSSGHTSGTRNNVSRAGTRRSDFTYITGPEGVLFMLKRGETRRKKKVIGKKEFSGTYFLSFGMWGKLISEGWCLQIFFLATWSSLIWFPLWWMLGWEMDETQDDQEINNAKDK